MLSRRLAEAQPAALVNVLRALLLCPLRFKRYRDQLGAGARLWADLWGGVSRLVHDKQLDRARVDGLLAKMFYRCTHTARASPDAPG